MVSPGVAGLAAVPETIVKALRAFSVAASAELFKRTMTCRVEGSESCCQCGTVCCSYAQHHGVCIAVRTTSEHVSSDAAYDEQSITTNRRKISVFAQIVESWNAHRHERSDATET